MAPLCVHIYPVGSSGELHLGVWEVEGSEVLGVVYGVVHLRLEGWEYGHKCYFVSCLVHQHHPLLVPFVLVDHISHVVVPQVSYGHRLGVWMRREVGGGYWGGSAAVGCYD